MIEMFVAGITMDQAHSCPILVLVDAQKQRALPFWISPTDASSMLSSLSGDQHSRPMTHELTIDILANVGWQIEDAEINEVKDDVLMASLRLKPREGSAIEGQDDLIIDARPSDAVALALKAQAPILVSLEIVASATIPADFKKDKNSAEQFERFVQDLKASDFNTITKRERGS